MEYEGFFLKVVLEIVEELISLMKIPMLRDQSYHDEVDDVCIPRGMARDGKEMLIRECVTNVSSSTMETR